MDPDSFDRQLPYRPQQHDTSGNAEEPPIGLQPPVPFQNPTSFRPFANIPPAWDTVDDVYCTIKFSMRDVGCSERKLAIHFSKYNDEKRYPLGSVSTIGKLRDQVARTSILCWELDHASIDLPVDALLLVAVGKGSERPKYIRDFTPQLKRHDSHPIWSEIVLRGHVDIRNPREWKKKGYEATIWFVLPEEKCVAYKPEELFKPKDT